MEVPFPTVDVWADPTSISSGEMTSISWQTAGASEVTLVSMSASGNEQRFDVGNSGNRDFTPTEGTTFSVIAKNQRGTDSDFVDVAVDEAVDTKPPVRFKSVEGDTAVAPTSAAATNGKV